MIKRKFTSEVYAKMGHPDLENVIYMTVSGKKVYGKVSLLSFCGFKNAKKGLVLLGIEPFKKISKIK